MDTHVNKRRSPFSVGYITSIKESLTVDLTRNKLKGQMSNGPSISADGILISLDELYAEAVDKQVAVTSEEELECDGDKLNRLSSRELSTGKKLKSGKKVTKLSGPYAKMGEDISSLGLETLRGKNILEVRTESACRTKERNVLR